MLYTDSSYSGENMSYTQNKDGYALETDFADGTTLDSADDTAYLIGRLASTNIWPSPEFGVNYGSTGVNSKEVDIARVMKTQAELRGMLTLMPQNGIPIWLALGKSSTAGADPYTHTVTPATDGSLLPSVVFHHEESGSGTDEEYQFQGCKVDSILLSHDTKGPDMLMAKLEIMAGKAVDPAFTLTNDPALPATANSGPFIELTKTWDYGAGNTALQGLQQVEIAIANGLVAKYADSWDTGVYTGMWPYMLAEANRKQYDVSLVFHPDNIERAMWDELISLTNTKELYFKWTRGTDDYIAITLTDCQVTSHQIITEQRGDLKLLQATLEPRAMSVEVKDSIAGSAYGE